MLNTFPIYLRVSEYENTFPRSSLTSFQNAEGGESLMYPVFHRGMTSEEEVLAKVEEDALVSNRQKTRKRTRKNRLLERRKSLGK
mmetsp:Transcript_8872/g.13439  ORF Transcript_8872/g.13439 Transcript_8872/m.13439 type:complete len:85 (-) Transcript_8872:91-345(-)